MAESKRTAGGLEGYDPSMFDKPSVTVDILVVTAGKRKKGGRADESGDGLGMKIASLRRRGSAKERTEPALQLIQCLFPFLFDCHNCNSSYQKYNECNNGYFIQ